MNPDITPTRKAAATLFLADRKGVILPILDDAFESCAKVLRNMSPPEEGCELWIECMGLKLDSVWVQAHLNPDKNPETE